MEGKKRGVRKGMGGAEELVFLSLLYKGPVSVGVCVPLSLLKSARPLGGFPHAFTHLGSVSVEMRSGGIECQHCWNDNDRAAALGQQPMGAWETSVS